MVRDLTQALVEEDLAGIRNAVARAREALGEQVGIPEEPDAYRVIPPDAKLLSREEIQAGFQPYFKRLESMRWWKVGADPTWLKEPLRAPANIIMGMVATHRAGLDGAEHGLQMARDAAEFLMWAQDQAGTGVYPFPAARDTSNARAMQVGSRMLKQAEQQGRLGEMLRNGWVIEDFGDGGLQFDNGECGLALLELNEVTGDARYLESARKAAGWAMSRPLCPNWNYNAFSVDLLARCFMASREPAFLESALKKARLGVIPGQLTEGPRAGRWLDPHNARPPYHYILMRSLARLALALPAEHPNREEVLDALGLGLQTRNTEMVERGVMDKHHSVETLLLVTKGFQDDEAFLRQTRSQEALACLFLLASHEFHQGKFPLSPGPWGGMLERMKNPGLN